jgi:hypothetical protein
MSSLADGLYGVQLQLISFSIFGRSQVMVREKSEERTLCDVYSSFFLMYLKQPYKFDQTSSLISCSISHEKEPNE